MKDRKNIIVVLNYNDWEETIRFCKMVEPFSSVDMVVIVDNKSTDNSVNELKSIQSEKVKLVVAEENRGYAAGNNVGLRFILDNGLRGNIIISNPDIYFSDNGLKKILAPLGDERIGVSTGLITMHGNIISNYAWKVPSFWELVSNMFLITYKVKRVLGLGCYLKYPKDEERIYCNCVSGCFFCMTTETLQRVGLFDERTFLFGEENILGYRMKQAGLKTCVVTSGKVEHDQHHSINKSKISRQRERKWDRESISLYINSYLRKGVVYRKLFCFLYRVALLEQKLILAPLKYVGLYRK